MVRNYHKICHCSHVRPTPSTNAIAALCADLTYMDQENGLTTTRGDASFDRWLFAKSNDALRRASPSYITEKARWEMASTAAWCIRTSSKRRLLSNATKLIVAFIPSFALGVTSSELQNMARIATNKQCQDIMAKVSLLLVDRPSSGQGVSSYNINQIIPRQANT